MEQIIDTVLDNTVLVRKDLFGEDSTYIRFDERDVDSREFSGLQSSLRFGRIIYRHQREKKARYSEELILKVTPSAVLIKNFSALQFFNEAFFYTRVLPLFQTFGQDIRHQLFPQYYNSLLQYSVHGDEAVLVFENLRASDFTQCPRKSFLDFAHLRLMMRKLGYFHAHSYRARQENPYEFHALVRCQLESSGHYFEYFPGLVPSKERGYEPLMIDPNYNCRIEHLRQLLAKSQEVFSKSLRGDEKNSTHVVCHGDFLGNNVLFAYGKERLVDMRMVDLGTWRFASPAFDLAMVLYLNADQEMRDTHWELLLNEYYAAVRGTFPAVEVPSKDSILAEFKTEATLTAYLIASFFLPALIASDNNGVPGQEDLVPSEYKDAPLGFLPPHVLEVVLENQGGDRATRALTDILKDMVDRGFV